jgi:hypothetical protein
MPHSRSPAPGTAADLLQRRLDELLPLGQAEGHEVHYHAAVLEVEGPAQLLELAADSAIRPLLLCRLGPGAVLVEEGAAERLVELLHRRGHTPKVVR